jgi:hypothetical protein
VIALGMRAMARAGEIAAIMIADIWWVGKALLVIVCCSKMDLSGRGQEVFINSSGGLMCLVGILCWFLLW